MTPTLGLHTCVACEWNSTDSEVIRWWDSINWKWRYSRYCSRCGSVFPATKAEYEDQEQSNPISPWAAYTPTRQPAGTPTEWKGLDDYSTYDGSTWRDVIEDVNGETWQRIRRNIGDDPPWHPVTLPGHKKDVTINLRPLKDEVDRHQRNNLTGMIMQVETVTALVAEIERLRPLVAEMQACIAEALSSAEEACNV